MAGFDHACHDVPMSRRPAKHQRAAMALLDAMVGRVARVGGSRRVRVDAKLRAAAVGAKNLCARASGAGTHDPSETEGAGRLLRLATHAHA